MNQLKYRLSFLLLFFFTIISSSAQKNSKTKYSNPLIYTGIEVGSKGIKMSVIEIGANAQTRGAFKIIKDTSVNTDFISFDESSFQATLNGLSGLYKTALLNFSVPADRIFTVVSSGVRMQAEKDSRLDMINTLIDSFKIRINEKNRKVELVDVAQEGKLSHLGIVPESRRYNTFLIDVGSGNTKGGFFPYGNTKDFKLFQLNWGTKSIANATDASIANDKSMDEYYRQLQRILNGAEQKEIIYAVNESGAYPVSDNIAISGGISWAISSLMFPEFIENTVVPVTYAEVEKFYSKLRSNFNACSPKFLTLDMREENEKKAAFNELSTIHKVFDQRSLLAGTGLLLKIMRQFESIYTSKQFYLVKNGQVGWISAYVEQSLEK